MPKLAVTPDEWRREALRLSKGDGFSSAELAVKLKVEQSAAQERLRRWVRAGSAYLAGFRRGLAIDGREIRVPLYRLR